MENAENFSDGKGITKPKKLETFVKVGMEQNSFGQLRKPNNHLQKKNWRLSLPRRVLQVTVTLGYE